MRPAPTRSHLRVSSRLASCMYLSPPGYKSRTAYLTAISSSICIISVLRMKSLLTVSYTDITYSVVDALIWSMLEPALGIALACMPIIRPLFSKIFPDRLTSRSKSKTSSKNSMLAPKGDAKNFQRIQDQSGYALGPLRPDNMTSTYDTHLKSHQEDIESQTSLRSESELVLPASRIKVKSDWKISTNEA